MSAGKFSIPQKNIKHQVKNVSWWNEKCDKTLKLTKNAKNKYKRHKSQETKDELTG